MTDDRNRDVSASDAATERPQDSSAAIRANDAVDPATTTADEGRQHRQAGSASRTGERKKGDDLSDIGGTDEMTSSTGGLAGTSR